MQDMNRIITIIMLAAAMLVSCQEEIQLKPAASLFTAEPELTDTTAIFRLAVANVKAAEEPIRFPVKFGGTAEKGIDYTVSSEAFVFGGEEPVDSIVVTTLKLGTEKTLSMSVMLPEGYEAGKYTHSEYKLQDKMAFVSYTARHRSVIDSIDVAFSLNDKAGKMKALGYDVEVTMNVNREKSTAIEGTDFIFSDSTRFIIPAGETKGVLEIKSLNKQPEEGKDKIVLNLSYSDRFGEGMIGEMEISLLDEKWKALEGTWMPDSLVTDAAYMQEYWKDACTSYEDVPGYYNWDTMAFDMESLMFLPDFSSHYSYFFIGDSNLIKGKTMELELVDGSKEMIQTFIIDKTNRYFTQKNRSEDTESYIGLRLIDGETDGQQMLDLYILDHTSRFFMPELEATGKYAPEKPVAASPGLYLNLIFTKE